MSAGETVGQTDVAVSDGLAEVHLPGYPLDWHHRAQEQYDELAREFALIAVNRGSEDAQHQVPRRLLELVEALTARFAGVTDAVDHQRDAAAARGERTVDLVYRVPATAKEAAIALDRMLDEADEFCRRGDLLTLATPPALVAWRRWYLGEFVRQIDGEPPGRWQPDPSWG